MQESILNRAEAFAFLQNSFSDLGFTKKFALQTYLSTAIFYFVAELQ